MKHLPTTAPHILRYSHVGIIHLPCHCRVAAKLPVTSLLWAKHPSLPSLQQTTGFNDTKPEQLFTFKPSTASPYPIQLWCRDANYHGPVSQCGLIHVLKKTPNDTIIQHISWARPLVTMGPTCICTYRTGGCQDANTPLWKKLIESATVQWRISLLFPEL